jgi:hypothetical protein
MPRGDGMGPAGMGPMTGRGRGFCAGFKTPGYASPGFGRGTESGRGKGYGRMLWLAWILPGCLFFARRRANRDRMYR